MTTSQAPGQGEADLVFYNSKECLFAQRTWICLIEKGVPFKLVEFDLRHPTENRYLKKDEKPAWLLDMNPAGKVCTHRYQRCSLSFLTYSS